MTTETRLRLLASRCAPASPPATPIDLPASLGRPIALATLEERWGPATPLTGDGREGWRRLGWTQSWFGQPGLETRYTFDPDGGLVRVDVSGEDFEALAGALQAALGEPDDAGRSPQFLSSDRYQTWLREEIRFTVEDFKPGFSLGILRLP